MRTGRRAPNDREPLPGAGRSPSPTVPADGGPPPNAGRAPVAALASTFALALVLRVVHALATDPVLSSVGDNTTFRETARSVASGHWGRLPTMDGSWAISVKFPPLWPWMLGAGQRVLWFLDPDTANAVWSVLLGAVVAPLAGLLAWRLLDRLPNGARRLAAGGTAVVAAVHPLLIGATNSLMSEVVVVPISLGVLLLVDHVHRAGPTRRSLVALGLVLALATLARFEALVLWGAVLLFVAWALRRWSVVVVPVALALVPALAFSAVASRAAHEPVLVSTNAASAVAGANCEVTWSGEAIGHWSRTCLERVWLGRIPPDQRSVIYAHERLPRQQERIPLQLGPRLEAQLQSEQRHAALFEIRRHPLQVAGAVPFRLARGLGLWWSPDQTRLEVAEGRIVGWEVAGRWFHLAVVLPAFVLAALATLRRRGRLASLLDRCADRRRLLPLGVAVVMWLAGVAATHGSTRHRAAVDAVFLVGAAVGFALVLARREARPAAEG